MTEENKGAESSEVVRDLIIPGSQKSAEESGDRSPTKTERNEFQSLKVEPTYSDNKPVVRELVIPTDDAASDSEDGDRSPTKTERGLE